MDNLKLKTLQKSFMKNTMFLAIFVIILLSLLAASISYFSQITSFKKESERILENFISKELKTDVSTLLLENENKKEHNDLIKKIELFTDISNLVEFKIWDKNYRMVYSFTNKENIGKKFPDNEELRNIFKNKKPVLSLTKPDKNENRNLRGYGSLLEMYLPIVSEDKKLQGVFEVYRDAPTFNFFGKQNILLGLFVLLLGISFNFLIASKFRNAFETIIDYHKSLETANENITKSYLDSVISLAKALEMRDMETEGHSERVVNMSFFIGKKLNLSKQELGKLVIGAYLHDIGKIGVPDYILLKPGKLNPEERAVIETHTIKGRDIIKSVPFLENASDVILYHHEKWDGSGYPFGLKGEEIPLNARIFAVVDVFDALISKRPYKEPFPIEKIMKIISEEQGKHFCPQVSRIILNMSHDEILSINKGFESKQVKATIQSAVVALIDSEFFR
jgi:HD-GYP domain-containing protein (c-di-GMP phosphodiesterase class II)